MNAKCHCTNCKSNKTANFQHLRLKKSRTGHLKHNIFALYLENAVVNHNKSLWWVGGEGSEKLEVWVKSNLWLNLGFRHWFIKQKQNLNNNRNSVFFCEIWKNLNFPAKLLKQNNVLLQCTNGFVVYNIQYSNCNVYSSFTTNIFRVHIRYKTTAMFTVMVLNRTAISKILNCTALFTALQTCLYVGFIAVLQGIHVEF